MVNENFDKFRKVQSTHKSEYLDGTQERSRNRNDSQYNNRSDTDKSPGATGRK
ncbi:hypothetical protein JMM81_07605 [Bacillus sp. V3B]|uniref:hypothetical protein n=1 Tax=Bacillus sp. V3B TaxID=2804915 RepID=UPI002108F7D2|nr:hypothetical protein [Bacillus sp. V3B]MCQ6274835.1 hypothetical protein [Bacillus sp. V3B]